jgi:hypothetical protein
MCKVSPEGGDLEGALRQPTSLLDGISQMIFDDQERSALSAHQW